MKDRIDIHWLDPVKLCVDDDADEAGLVRSLQRQLKAGYRDQDVTDAQMLRSVYIVRLTGSFVINYPRGTSPVLYVGRGNAPSRLATHLARWLSDAFTFGSDTEVEIRMLRPRRKGHRDYFKNVEADLLEMFFTRMGSLPFFNGRYETKYAECVDYGPSQEKRLWQQLGTGSGNRPRWALTPMPANPNYARYQRGQA